MTITAIPTRTVGSLGLTKVNRRAVSDPYKQADASEYNLAADCLVHLITQVGIESSPAWDSIQGILNSGDTFYRNERFTALTAGDPFWSTFVVAPTRLTTARAGLRFTLDAAKGVVTNGDYFNRGQKPYLRARITLDGNPDHWDIRFVDSATGNEGWGIAVETGGTKIRGYTRAGGVNTYTDVSTWAVSTEFVLEMWVASNTLYVSKNGATAVSCGAVAAGDRSILMTSVATGVAGKLLDVRNMIILADWSA